MAPNLKDREAMPCGLAQQFFSRIEITKMANKNNFLAQTLKEKIQPPTLPGNVESKHAIERASRFCDHVIYPEQLVPND